MRDCATYTCNNKLFVLFLARESERAKDEHCLFFLASFLLPCSQILPNYWSCGMPASSDLY
ncbi:hypothetical protein IF1G_04363 [Cordyceps javanica]|uniref:Uncharacterized protein n=1 Tax=Cordyceps javanica TaxID=43265 RepID=A0A545V5Y2_9HYPO|nr:hypothetical protein IF1G_04363 [Cordyceps javanica]